MVDDTDKNLNFGHMSEGCIKGDHYREVDMKPYGLTHSTHDVGYSLFQC